MGRALERTLQRKSARWLSSILAIRSHPPGGNRMARARGSSLAQCKRLDAGFAGAHTTLITLAEAIVRGFLPASGGLARWKDRKIRSLGGAVLSRSRSVQPFRPVATAVDGYCPDFCP